MLLTVLLGAIFTAVLAGLLFSAWVIRGRQRALSAKREAAQLQRRADHLFKIALAAQVHTRSDAIARALIDEAVRVLEYSLQLDRDAELTVNSLRECRELIENINAEPKHAVAETRDAILDFPEAELIEAQLHLTEAARLLIGLEKRGQISYAAFSDMTTALKQAQRALDLRLQLHQASHALNADNSTAKLDVTRAGEYLAAIERDRAQSSH